MAKAGERYQCGTCGTQVVVIKTEGETPQCCGAPMEGLATAKPAPKPAAQG
jgi:hypothetical protein